MLDFLWNASQDAQQHETQRQVAKSEETALDAKARVTLLEHKLERLTLVTEALWEIVKHETGRKDADLIAIMTDLDLSDGKRDGKHRRPAAKCHQCGKVFQRAHARCMYCNATNREASAFDGL